MDTAGNAGTVAPFARGGSWIRFGVSAIVEHVSWN